MWRGAGSWTDGRACCTASARPSASSFTTRSCESCAQGVKEGPSHDHAGLAAPRDGNATLHPLLDRRLPDAGRDPDGWATPGPDGPVRAVRPALPEPPACPGTARL